jgi:hypothetical protein
LSEPASMTASGHFRQIGDVRDVSALHLVADQLSKIVGGRLGSNAAFEVKHSRDDTSRDGNKLG